ncbi:hypothetical protein BJF78_26330 [Pseudonocardia sp. CNS-139]|nr:hypothetical protein BJF78_26330 [Pseudonocardia sp. CNS-139]
MLLPALLVFGAGVGAAFVACQIAALTGVREDESGLAAGLVDTSFHLGNASASRSRRRWRSRWPPRCGPPTRASTRPPH